MIEVLTTHAKEYAEIEELVRVLKYTFVPKLKKQQLQNQLVKLVLTVKGLSKFVDAANVINVCMADLPGYNGYSGGIFFEAYRYAWENYGRVDQTTGEVMPFMLLFNNLYKLKRNKLVREKIEEADGLSMKAKEERMRAFLRQRHLLKPNEPKINVLNLGNVKALLDKAKLGPKAHAEAESIIANCLVSSDVVTDSEGSETLVAQSDSVARSRYEDAESAMLTIVDGVEFALTNTRSLTLQRYICYYVTLKALSFQPTVGMNTGVYLDKYVDKDLASYMQRANPFGDETTVLAEYLHQERETVRKNLRKAQLALLDYMEQCA